MDWVVAGLGLGALAVLVGFAIHDLGPWLRVSPRSPAPQPTAVAWRWRRLCQGIATLVAGAGGVVLAATLVAVLAGVSDTVGAWIVGVVGLLAILIAGAGIVAIAHHYRHLRNLTAAPVLAVADDYLASPDVGPLADDQRPADLPPALREDQPEPTIADGDGAPIAEVPAGGSVQGAESAPDAAGEAVEPSAPGAEIEGADTPAAGEPIVPTLPAERDAATGAPDIDPGEPVPEPAPSTDQADGDGPVEAVAADHAAAAPGAGAGPDAQSEPGPDEGAADQMEDQRLESTAADGDPDAAGAGDERESPLAVVEQSGR